MDLMTYSSVTEDDYRTLTISVLRPNTIGLLSGMLNSQKILLTPENLPRDWRGLFALLDFNIPSGYKQTDPIRKILEFCSKKTLYFFIDCLERIDRYDVIDDTEKWIISDIEYFKKQKCASVNPTMLSLNYSDTDIITDDDVYASTNGLPLPKYDAFLLFDYADTEIAITIKNKLENDFKFKLFLKDRNLRPGVEFESNAIIKLISDRCNWLIIIVSNDFLNSSENRFIMKYVQSLAIEKSIRKIIPCVFYDCTIPLELRYHVRLNFHVPNPFRDPWDTLQKTLAPNYPALTSSEKPEKPNVQQNKSEFSEELPDNSNANDGELIEEQSIEQNEQEHEVNKEKNNTVPNTSNVFKKLIKSVVPKKLCKKKLKNL